MRSSGSAIVDIPLGLLCRIACGCFFGTLTSLLCNVFLISLPLYLAGVAFVDTLWVAGVLNGAATVWIVFREVVGLREMLDDIEADRDDI